MKTGEKVVTPMGRIGTIIATRLATFAGRKIPKHRIAVEGRGDGFWFFEHQLAPR